MTESDAAHEVVDRLFREEQGRAVATLIRVTGDFDLAEEAVQEAFISALETWPQPVSYTHLTLPTNREV